MSDTLDDIKLASLLMKHGTVMSAALQVQSKTRFKAVSGRLSTGFKPKVVIQGGDVAGISFSTVRYAYILNHGVKSQTVRRKGSSYTTKGFAGDRFIERVRDQYTGKIAQDVSSLYAKQIVERFQF